MENTVFSFFVNVFLKNKILREKRCVIRVWSGPVVDTPLSRSNHTPAIKEIVSSSLYSVRFFRAKGKTSWKTKKATTSEAPKLVSSFIICYIECTDGRSTLTSQARFLGWIVYQMFLAMGAREELRYNFVCWKSVHTIRCFQLNCIKITPFSTWQN